MVRLSIQCFAHHWLSTFPDLIDEDSPNIFCRLLRQFYISRHTAFYTTNFLFRITSNNLPCSANLFQHQLSPLLFFGPSNNASSPSKIADCGRAMPQESEMGLKWPTSAAAFSPFFNIYQMFCKHSFEVSSEDRQEPAENFEWLENKLGAEMNFIIPFLNGSVMTVTTRHQKVIPLQILFVTSSAAFTTVSISMQSFWRHFFETL